MAQLLSQIRHRSLKAVLAHWVDARGEEIMPRRSDIDPLEMVEALSSAWIYRLEDDGDFYCRLAGSDIDRAWGRCITNHAAVDIIGPDYEGRVKPRWLFMLRKPAALHQPFMKGSETKAVERLVLPIANEHGKPCQVLGVSQYFYPSPASEDLPVCAFSRIFPGLISR